MAKLPVTIACLILWHAAVDAYPSYIQCGHDFTDGSPIMGAPVKAGDSSKGALSFVLARESTDAELTSYTPGSILNMTFVSADGTQYAHYFQASAGKLAGSTCGKGVASGVAFGVVATKRVVKWTAPAKGSGQVIFTVAAAPGYAPVSAFSTCLSEAGGLPCGAVPKPPPNAKVPTWVTAHAICMILAWNLLAPLAMFSARFLDRKGSFGISGSKICSKDKWLFTHITSNTTAVALTIAGAVLSFMNANTFASGVPTKILAHGILGVCVLSFSVLQVLIGLARPHKVVQGPQSTLRVAWEWVHLSIGRTCLLMGFANVILGMFVNSLGNAVFWLVVVADCLWLCCGITLEVLKQSNKTAVAEPPLIA